MHVILVILLFGTFIVVINFRSFLIPILHYPNPFHPKRINHHRLVYAQIVRQIYQQHQSFMNQKSIHLITVACF